MAARMVSGASIPVPGDSARNCRTAVRSASWAFRMESADAVARTGAIDWRRR
jgi:hypothetical protein